jgi:hypothetical protein
MEFSVQYNEWPTILGTYRLSIEEKQRLKGVHDLADIV